MDVKFWGEPHKNFPCSKMALLRWSVPTPSPTPPQPLSQAVWLKVTDDWMLFVFSPVIFFDWWPREVPVEVALCCLVKCVYSFVLALRAFPRVTFIDFRIWLCVLDTSWQLHAQYLWWLILGYTGCFILFRSILGKRENSHGERSSFTSLSLHLQGSHIWQQRRQWHPTLVLLPGKSHGQRSLVGCSPRGREQSDTTEQLHFHFSLSCIGGGNGNPLQCSCLENPRDGGAWWDTELDTTEVT